MQGHEVAATAEWGSKNRHTPVTLHWDAAAQRESERERPVHCSDTPPGEREPGRAGRGGEGGGAYRRIEVSAQ